MRTVILVTFALLAGVASAQAPTTGSITGIVGDAIGDPKHPVYRDCSKPDLSVATKESWIERPAAKVTAR